MVQIYQTSVFKVKVPETQTLQSLKRSVTFMSFLSSIFAVQFLFLLALFLFTERVKMTTSQFPWEPICFSARIKQSIVQQNQLLFHNQNNTLATFVKANPVILPFTQKSIDANFTVNVGFGHSLSVYLQFKLAIYFARCQENKTR